MEPLRKSSYLAVLICGGLILALALGLRQSFGLFQTPITGAIDVSRNVFSLSVGLQNILWGLATPLFGVWADKIGTGRALAAGGAAYSAGLMLQAFATGPVQLIVGSLLLGVGLGGVGFTVVLGAVSRASPPQVRSTAMGIAAASGSLGQFVIVPYAHLLLDTLGWSLALVAMAATAMLMIPAAAGVAGHQSDRHMQAAQTAREALREAFAHRGYWLLVAGFFVCGFQVVFVGTHLPAFLSDQGMPTWLAGWALALVGLFNIAGSYGAGWLGGRYRKKYLLAALYVARSLMFVLFLALPLSVPSVLVFACGLGLLWLGTVPLTTGLVGQIFGQTYLSMLYGIVFLSHQLGSFFGAWLGGLAYDQTGSYDVMWWICVALGLGAALLHWPIMDRPLPRPVLAGAAAQ